MQDPPNSSALRVSRALMPGLVPAVGTQAVSRSRRQSHAVHDVPWGWCRDLEAGAEGMAVGRPAAVKTLSPCTSPARTYIRDRESRVTSAFCAHAGLTAVLWPPKAHPCPTRDSKGKPVPPLFPTHACRGSRGKQGPHAISLPAPHPGGVQEPGALARTPNGSVWLACGDMQRPSWARVSRGFGSPQLEGAGGAEGCGELVPGQGGLYWRIGLDSFAQGSGIPTLGRDLGTLCGGT